MGFALKQSREWRLVGGGRRAIEQDGPWAENFGAGWWVPENCCTFTLFLDVFDFPIIKVKEWKHNTHHPKCLLQTMTNTWKLDHRYICGLASDIYTGFFPRKCHNGQHQQESSVFPSPPLEHTLTFPPGEAVDSQTCRVGDSPKRAPMQKVSSYPKAYSGPEGF